LTGEEFRAMTDQQVPFHRMAFLTVCR
jgi:hypothetical protein